MCKAHQLVTGETCSLRAESISYDSALAYVGTLRNVAWSTVYQSDFDRSDEVRFVSDSAA